MTELSAGDRIEIHELLARRAQASDFAVDASAWAATFTPDGVLEQPPVTLDLPGGEAEMQTRTSGTEELRTFMAAALPNISGLRHRISNVVSDATEDGAVATSLFEVVDVGRGGVTVVSGRYTDTLRRTAGGWLTSHLKVEMDPAS
jgi:hypothetical protein